MFLLYPFYAVGTLLATLLTVILSPVLALLKDKENNLPYYLYYFQTFDAPLYDGWWDSVKWLCRNPAYGFDLFVFGLPWVKEDWTCVKNTSTEKGDLFIGYNKQGAFCFAFGSKMKLVPSVKFGWKAYAFHRGGVFIEKSYNDLNYGRVPFCFSVEPFHY